MAPGGDVKEAKVCVCAFVYDLCLGAGEGCVDRLIVRPSEGVDNTM